MLEVNNIEVSYDDVTVIRGVSFTVKEGQLVSIIGNNGAGKSTIMKTISATLKPKKGKIIFRGENIDGMHANSIARKGLIHVPEGRQIFTNLTVKENLMMGAFPYYYTKGKDRIKEDLEDIFKKFPVLKERQKILAGYISGGEQQMLAIGRALMARPKFLLLDEPSLGLAPVIVDQIFSLIKELRNEGKTILLVEQRALQALEISDDSYVLANGEIVFHGTKNQILENEKVKNYYLGIDN